MSHRSDGLPKRKKPSVLDPHLEQIRALAAQGYTCPEIVEALNLPVQPEQVRRQMHRHGIPLLAKRGAQPGSKNPSWNGGRIVDKGGYILVKAPDHPQANNCGYVREHRLVMEAHIGRYLESQEVVHHINGDTADNRIENLELFANNAEHLRVTLAGKVPNWTKEGWARIQEGIDRGQEAIAARRKEASDTNEPTDSLEQSQNEEAVPQQQPLARRRGRSAPQMGEIGVSL